MNINSMLLDEGSHCPKYVIQNDYFSVWCNSFTHDNSIREIVLSGQRFMI